jgi:hypothetical protein
MVDTVYVRNIGELISGVRLGAHAALIGANTGLVIDREANPGSAAGPPLSMAAMLSFNVVMTATDVLTVAWVLNDSADGTNFAALQTVAAAPIFGPVAAGTYNRCATIPVILTSARRYIRWDYTTAGPAGAIQTDAVGVFGGWDRLAAPNIH